MLLFSGTDGNYFKVANVALCAEFVHCFGMLLFYMVATVLCAGPTKAIY